MSEGMIFKCYTILLNMQFDAERVGRSLDWLVEGMGIVLRLKNLNRNAVM
jgi:hypothetical protein